MSNVTRRIVAGIGPPTVVVVVGLSGLTTLLTTIAPPRTAPAVAAPAPAPMRKSRRVTENPCLLCVSVASGPVPGEMDPPCSSPMKSTPVAFAAGKLALAGRGHALSVARHTSLTSGQTTLNRPQTKGQAVVGPGTGPRTRPFADISAHPVTERADRTFLL